MKPINILLVEDNEGDILLTREAFEDSKIINDIAVIKDGEAAIAFFEQLTATQAPPDLVLLDVNLPKRSGHEVLKFLKENERFKVIPVVMLTTSSSEKDVNLSYSNHVNCFITKPIEINEFMIAMAKIEDFWIHIVSIPKNR